MSTRPRYYRLDFIENRPIEWPETEQELLELSKKALTNLKSVYLYSYLDPVFKKYGLDRKHPPINKRLLLNMGRLSPSDAQAKIYQSIKDNPPSILTEFITSSSFQTTIEQISYEKTPIDQALEQLFKQANMNIQVTVDELLAKKMPLINLSLRNLSVERVLQFVTQQQGNMNLIVSKNEIGQFSVKVVPNPQTSKFAY